MAQTERPKHVGDHYKSVKLDTWDAIDAWFTPEMLYGFYAGNVIKYMQRAHLKNCNEDFKKARHYQDKVAMLLEQYPDLLEQIKNKDKKTPVEGTAPRPSIDPFPGNLKVSVRCPRCNKEHVITVRQSQLADIINESRIVWCQECLTEESLIKKD